MKSLKGRTIKPGQIIQVYYNLHQGGYSLKDKETGLVLGYAPTVLLNGCTFKVSQAGRRKTILEKRKRVHAYVEGTYVQDSVECDTSAMERVYYNPYETEEFTSTETGEQILMTPVVYLENKVCYID